MRRDPSTRSDGRTVSAAVTSVRFLTLLKRGQVPHAADAELRSGRAVRSRPLAGQVAAVVERLRRLLAAAASGTELEVLERPLVRVGAADLWRPELCVLAARHVGMAAVAATLEPGRLALLVEVASGTRLHERLAGFSAAGVREVWALDLVEGWTVRYRSPWRGLYRSRTLWYPGEELPLTALGGAGIEALEQGFTPAART